MGAKFQLGASREEGGDVRQGEKARFLEKQWFRVLCRKRKTLAFLYPSSIYMR